MRELCLDIETTGLDPRDGHKIIEIACVELVNKVKTGNNFHTYINPRRAVPDEAFRIHGISTEFLQDKPIFDHIAQKFLDFIGDSTLVIHNAPFDTKFLNYELKIIGLEPLETARIFDTLPFARSKFPGAQNSLDALCKRFNIDLSKRDKHGALLDTGLLADVYVELMGGIQSGFGFETPKNKSVTNLAEEKVARKILPARDFPPTLEQLELHRQFVTKNIKNSLWGS